MLAIAPLIKCFCCNCSRAWLSRESCMLLRVESSPPRRLRSRLEAVNDENSTVGMGEILSQLTWNSALRICRTCGSLIESKCLNRLSVFFRELREWKAAASPTIFSVCFGVELVMRDSEVRLVFSIVVCTHSLSMLRV